MYSAKWAIPIAKKQILQFPVIGQMVDYPITVFNAPSGYFPTEYLSSALSERGIPVVWMRLGNEDRDPATCLRSLIEASRSLSNSIGYRTQKRMKQYPGVIYGWSPLFEALAQEWQNHLPLDCKIVLEGIHHLGKSTPVLDLLSTHFLIKLSKTRNCILHTYTAFYAKHFLKNWIEVGLQELKSNTEEVFEIYQDENASLSRDCVHHLLQLSQGRSVVILGILNALRGESGIYIGEAIRQADDLEHLLVYIARACLLSASRIGSQSLALTLETGYFQNDIFREVLGENAFLDGPWSQQLRGDWMRLHKIWDHPLRLVLHNYLDTNLRYACKLAQAFEQQGAIEIAIPLLIKAREFEQAAQMIVDRIDDLMNYGQWELLNRWIEHIPTSVVDEFPWLAYAQAEIHAMYGQVDAAHHTFIQIGRKFPNNEKIACRSLLADSVLTARKGDKPLATECAQTAYDLSKSSALNQERGWACYQLAVLAGGDNDPSQAYVFLTESMQFIDDPSLRDWLKQVKDMIRLQENLKAQYEEHIQQLRRMEKTQNEIFKRLLALIHTPPEALPEMLDSNGWMGIPFALKIPYPNHQNLKIEQSSLNKIYMWIVRVINGSRPIYLPSKEKTLSPLDLVVPLPVKTEQPSILSSDRVAARPNLELKPTPQGKKTPESQLMVYTLGSLQVLRDRHFVASWSSRKAQLIFKYLLLHRHSFIPNDTLMEVFWPEADLESARRNLHQGIYNLRQTLKGIEYALHFIEFENEGYRINPSIDIWLDFEVFEQHCVSGQAKEHSGHIKDAMTDYSLAEELYQDHLFTDDPYEDWIQPYRQYYWQIYLSAIAKLADYHYQTGNFSGAISIAQRVLHKDRCQEFSYQILMRCFHEQGQRQLALHQYELCRQALMDDLEIEPSAKTTQLFLKILNE